jgi:hypothetical protein
MAATVRIRIVANVDASLANVFTPLTTAAKRARAAVGEEMGAAAAAVGPYRTAAQGAAAATTAIATTAKHTQTALGSLADGAGEKFAHLARGIKELPADLRTVASVAQAELAKIERAQARAALGLGPQPGAAFARSLGGGIGRQLGGPIGSALGREAGSALGVGGMIAAFPLARLAMGAVSGAARLGGDLIQGLGVNTDISSMFAQQKSLESLATNVSAFGYMPNDPRNSTRVDSQELVHEARAIGVRTGIDPTQALEGLEKFVGKTGDLKTGRDALEDLARLSKASGANLNQMVSAAGDVSNVLGDIPDKGKVIYDVMKQVAGEGKTGAVLIKDLATQMAKVASAAQMFEGDRSKNIGVLGAIAQEARGRGGAASANQAATAVQGFTNVFGKHARVEAFKGFGVELRGKTGQLREADDIIVDTLNAAMRGGTKMSGGKHSHAVKIDGGVKEYANNWRQMFADVSSQRAVAGFSATYLDAYNASKANTQQGRMEEATAAVRAEFERLTSSAMSEKEVQDSFAKAMATSESQVTVFNNQISDTAANLEKALLPALLELAPDLVLLAQGAAGAAAALLGVSLPKPKSAEDRELDRDKGGVRAAQEALDKVQAADDARAVPGQEFEYGKGPIAPNKLLDLPLPVKPTPFPDEVARQIKETEAREFGERTEGESKIAGARQKLAALGVPVDKITDDDLQNLTKYGSSGITDGMHIDATQVQEASKQMQEGKAEVADAQKNIDLAKAVESGVVAAFNRGLFVKTDAPPVTAPDPNASKRMPADSQ